MPVGVSAWTPLATLTLTGSQSSVTFSNIPQSYRDLIVVTNTATPSGYSQMYCRMNNNSTSIYRYLWMMGDGSVRRSGQWNNEPWIYGQTYTSEQGTAFQPSWLNIFDYTSTVKRKDTLWRLSSYVGTILSSGRFNSTSAVTSVTIGLSSNSFAVGSTFSLYGVSA